MLTTTTVSSPIGGIVLWARGERLVGLEFADRAERVRDVGRALARAFGETFAEKAGDPAGAEARLARYFAGDVTALDDQPVGWIGTPFQVRVWEALRRIPAGTTWSYGRLAGEIGRPTAVRAVGLANGANRISLVVPCHRVIGAGGALTGYGGGIDRKRWLLEHERTRSVAANRGAGRAPAPLPHAAGVERVRRQLAKTAPSDAVR